MCDYGDYYDEPSEFEQQIEEFKNSLYDCVKKEHKDAMAKLEKENKELQETKKNFDAIKTEYNNKLRELNIKLETAERDAKILKLNDLMQELKQILWQVKTTKVYDRKCDKCNNNRKIKFLSPSGKVFEEDCQCGIGVVKYLPYQYELYSFQQDRNSVDKWYRKSSYHDDDYYTEDSKRVDFLVKTEEDFVSIPERMYNVFFETEELCMKYCDIKNNENGITENMTEDRKATNCKKI